MTALQLVLSVIFAFLFPGLGQAFQAMFEPSRSRLAFAFLALGVLPIYLFIGVFTIWIVWLVALVECCLWAFRQPVLQQIVVLQPGKQVTQPIATAVLVCAVLLGCGAMAQAVPQPTAGGASVADIAFETFDVGPCPVPKNCKCDPCKCECCRCGQEGEPKAATTAATAPRVICDQNGECCRCGQEGEPKAATTAATAPRVICDQNGCRAASPIQTNPRPQYQQQMQPYPSAWRYRGGYQRFYRWRMF